MRLLNTSTLELAEFNESSVPPYIAISHTWDDEEINFADWQKPGREARAGYAKVKGSARVAKKHGADFIWIDTCCIDKSSSAELSEAINSMFKWYAAAEACHVYMADVAADAQPSVSYKPYFNGFWNSRWFKRGWTLQELLAPNRVEFFSKEWHSIGTKDEMTSRLSVITGIATEVLQGQRELSYVSVAERMSWASGRDTTRTEDIAYCLLGIFGVNMPLLYGEGEKAFIRLQEQIMREIDDQSLFAWADPNAAHGTPYGMLATHPRFFGYSGIYRALNEIPSPEPYTLTNKGLSISLRIEPSEDIPNHFLAALDCAREDLHDRFAAILLKPASATEPVYCRVQASKIGFSGGYGEPKKIFVRQNLLHTQEFRNLTTISLCNFFHSMPVRLAHVAVPEALRDATPRRNDHAVAWAPPSCRTIFGLFRRPGSVAAVLTFVIERDQEKKVFVCLGRHKDGTPGFYVSTEPWLKVPSHLEFRSSSQSYDVFKRCRISLQYRHASLPSQSAYSGNDLVETGAYPASHYEVDIQFRKPFQPEQTQI